MRELKGRLALVTGGARGIGRATAVELLREGARVVIADVDRAAAEETTRALAALGPIFAAELDVTSRAAFTALVERVEREHGAIDLLVNNAGIMTLGPFLEHDEALERKELEVNLFGVLNGMRAVLPGMLARRRGHIVNVASVAGRVGIPRATAYTASKFAVVGATESVRNELRGSGVELTYVMPYLVRTDLASGTRALRWPPEVEPEDVARALVDGVKRGRLEVYVPRIAQLTAVLPVLLPRALVDWMGVQLGLDQLFRRVDAAARAAYLARLGGEPGAPEGEGEGDAERPKPGEGGGGRPGRLRVLR